MYRDIRYSQGEYNWLEAWIVKIFSGFLDASFGSEASSRFKKIFFFFFLLNFYVCKRSSTSLCFSKLPGGLFSFSLQWIWAVLSSHLLCFFDFFMTMSRDLDSAI
jgi:hypothetical protein